MKLWEALLCRPKWRQDGRQDDLLRPLTALYASQIKVVPDWYGYGRPISVITDQEHWPGWGKWTSDSSFLSVLVLPAALLLWRSQLTDRSQPIFTSIVFKTHCFLSFPFISHFFSSSLLHFFLKKFLFMNYLKYTQKQRALKSHVLCSYRNHPCTATLLSLCPLPLCSYPRWF